MKSGLLRDNKIPNEARVGDTEPKTSDATKAFIVTIFVKIPQTGWRNHWSVTYAIMNMVANERNPCQGCLNFGAASTTSFAFFAISSQTFFF
nr:hypothetical protein [Candidatus Freyarchaeota archaeon]